MKNTRIIPLRSIEPNSKEVQFDVAYVKVGGATGSTTNPDPQLSDYVFFLYTFSFCLYNNL